MLAEAAGAIVGTGTHRDSHEVEIAGVTGKPIAMMRIGNDSGGFTQLLAAIAELAPGPRVAVLVEGSRWVADGHWCRLRCAGAPGGRGAGSARILAVAGAAPRRLLCAIGGAASIGHIGGAVAAPRHANLPRASIWCAGPWAARLGSPQQAGLTAPGRGPARRL